MEVSFTQTALIILTNKKTKLHEVLRKDGELSATVK